ncbi:uncharacterized protein BCR38DRAFT_480300 [Pseudomassariella vexata]|uniref:Uncharacterized protein n=1 Tax=Pseudomassariella vexata TaxID=1141098 RepID=A0A1Y2EJT7_9PEZI|nr:uncharacterized protein BCR38DRAFT_480300 [Pseudomassariella vexata]ORY71822.1 hypothetical protein BCR38DRAFT_480300 [Pseudomassariella vexata]
MATKWASERFLERVSEEAGGEWSVFIHRPSSISSRDEANAVPGSDITHATLRYSRLLGAVPDLSLSTGAFGFIDIETISGQIVADVVQSMGMGYVVVGSGGRKGVAYRH